MQAWQFVGEALKFSYQALQANRVRTLLTALGLLIGNASVILVVTISITSRDLIIDRIRGIGSNLITAYYDAGTQDSSRANADFVKLADVEAVRRELGSRISAASCPKRYWVKRTGCSPGNSRSRTAGFCRYVMSSRPNPKKTARAPPSAASNGTRLERTTPATRVIATQPLTAAPRTSTTSDRPPSRKARATPGRAACETASPWSDRRRTTVHPDQRVEPSAAPPSRQGSSVA